jgi:hypothetical protein
MFEEIAIIAVSSIGIIGTLLCVNLLKNNPELNLGSSLQ